jgi:DNA-binding MarR family transcriptional regulator
MRADDELAAFDRAFLLANRLSTAMGQALTERGLNTARAEVLYVLQNQGEMVQRQLSQWLHCTPRHVTTLIDTLAEADLVERKPHPTDRRAVLVALTDNGRALAGDLDTQRRASATEILGDVTDAELRGFIVVADKIAEKIGATPS